MGEYSAVSGIQVLDRAVAIMLAAAHQPSTLNELCDATGIPRATVHRLATALESHQILSRSEAGKWCTGPALPTGRDHLLEVSQPIMEALCATTGESIQLYRRTGATRTCVASVAPAHGLHNVVPVGRKLPLDSGSAAHVMAAFDGSHSPFLTTAASTKIDLDVIRAQGLSESMEEREKGLASISAPIINEHGTLIAVLSISGSSERFRPTPIDKFGTILRDAAAQLSAAV